MSSLAHEPILLQHREVDCNKTSPHIQVSGHDSMSIIISITSSPVRRTVLPTLRPTQYLSNQLDPITLYLFTRIQAWARLTYCTPSGIMPRSFSQVCVYATSTPKNSPTISLTQFATMKVHRSSRYIAM